MQGDAIPLTSVWPQPVLIMPIFTFGTLVGIALPLFIVTMASQNIPGIAVLRSYGYEPPSGRPIAVTGIISMVFAPFGGHTTNLSAIVAALCAGPDAHEDPAKRYWAAISMGIFSVVLGLLASLVIAVVQAAPPSFMQAPRKCTWTCA
jgi:benzoate membrane transport protein